QDHAGTQLQRRLDRVGDTVVGAAAVRAGVADDQAIDDDLDGVLLVLLELDVLAEVADRAVHAYADVAGLAGVLEHALVLALAVADQRRHDHDPGALGQLVDLVDDLLDGLLAHLAAAARAVGQAQPGEQQPHVV